MITWTGSITDMTGLDSVLFNEFRRLIFFLLKTLGHLFLNKGTNTCGHL